MNIFSHRNDFSTQMSNENLEQLNRMIELCDEILLKLGALDAANERLDNDLSYSDLQFPDINWRSFLSWFTTVKYKKD